MHSRKKIIKNTRAEKRKEQKRTLVRRIVWVCVSILCCIGGVAWASGYQPFTVTSVQIEGADLIDTDEVATYVLSRMEGRYGYLFSKKNVLLYPRTAIAVELPTVFPRIEYAELHYHGDNVLVVTIHERRPSFVWCPARDVAPVPVVPDIQEELENEDALALETKAKSEKGVEAELPTPTSSSGVATQQGCHFADRDGMIYASAPSFSGPVFFTWYGALVDTTLPIDGNRFLSVEEFDRSVKIIEGIKRAHMKPRYGVVGTDTIELTLAGGERLMYARDAEAEETVANFLAAKDALPEDASFEYMDMRFGTKVFYKEKEEDRVMSVSE
ncbi:MAG: hypothetical protein HGB03_01915 [Candidatus Yonathbacteria bacterium]|nr:hypothetical protein [Candidatus Yonathbacteria bacterium]NTW48015.1 hypothetical protein [Candidatus Yonathbacteria bacterium]